MEVMSRRLAAAALDEVDTLYRMAFGTNFGLADPMKFNATAEPLRTRLRADPERALVAEAAGHGIVGFVIASRWGSPGLFGPLGGRVDMQGRGFGRRLVEGVETLIAGRGCRHAALYTHLASPKTIALYQKYDYWPWHVATFMIRPAARFDVPGVTLFSPLDLTARAAALEACRAVADTALGGLDLGVDIGAVVAHDWGDTALLHRDRQLAGFAVCHTGAGTEAGSDKCVVKFAMVRPDASAHFDALLDACGTLVLDRGVYQLWANCNTGRRDAYKRMPARGFITQTQGVALHRHDDCGYNRPDAHLVDDWRLGSPPPRPTVPIIRS